nr:hypothetical protein [Tanacetum cinerariifolium]
MAVLLNYRCPKECRTVRQLLVDHALNYALTAIADVLAVTVGYQGPLNKVGAFFTKNLAQPRQTMFKVFNKCLTSRLTGHDQTKINVMQIFYAIINKFYVDYALLWTPRATGTPNPDDVVQKKKGKQAVREKRSHRLSLKNMAAAEQKMLDVDVKKLVEEEEEFDGIDFSMEEEEVPLVDGVFEGALEALGEALEMEALLDAMVVYGG